METEISEENEKETDPTDIDWEHRVLCSDGNCIGVIGPDGHCNECGKKYEGTLPQNHSPEKESPLPEDSTFEQEDQSLEEDMPPMRQASLMTGKIAYYAVMVTASV